MESQIKQLLEIIEEMKIDLNQQGSCKPLTDPAVVNLSEKLDKLLNQYYIMLNIRTNQKGNKIA
ncbi:aspartyl-phosphate phosphatase Spo0E family protein [Dehalobacter sp. TeCB1]|uniref:aspartyl-phosphate phosphatase Spo0E family protein n=1 Tax=Dehalobacter sp. TeCB1 TaxID=1843715 RepID=UPI00083A75F9|nr:aspartyl-phosphate phosphatase Spo0E family protein [Dehalobacter sp. TeCB1]OCZ54278.1 hypothetical protein A7D23_05785 [Dehalobacter sp. TeCB1]